MTLRIVCRAITPFTADGSVDLLALAAMLDRLVASQIDVMMCSTGSGEGGTLTRDECVQIYKSAVDQAKGQVRVFSNLPEEFTADRSIAGALDAVSAGVDIVNVYGPLPLHGYQPTDLEFLRYFDKVLAGVPHSVSLCPNPVMGYVPTPELLARICNEHGNVAAVLLSGTAPDGYFLRLMAALTRPVEVIPDFVSSPSTLRLGASGIHSPLANLIPRTFRSYLDAFESDELDVAMELYANIVSLGECFKAAPSARWMKVMLKAFDLPGGNGVMREPFLFPLESIANAWIERVTRLGITELEEQMG